MSNTKKLVLLAGDILGLYAALALTLFVRYRGIGFADLFRKHALPFSAIFILWVLVLYISDLYKPARFRNKKATARALFAAAAVGLALSIGVFYLFGGFFELTPKTNLVIFSAFFFAIGYLWRSSAFRIFSAEPTRTVFLGQSEIISEVVRRLGENPHMGYEMSAWIKNPAEAGSDELIKEIRDKGITLAVFHLSVAESPKALDVIYKLIPLGLRVMSFENFYEGLFDKAPLKELGQEWFIKNLYLNKPVYDKVKRWIEFALAAILLVVFSPVMAAAALSVKLASRGPIIYTQRRLGKDGLGFTLYKFRTMRNGRRGPLWTEENDKRVTAVGRVLRISHLDELPQLWNVVKGDISFIGPRPERVELAERYAALPYYDMRHIIKPGITGWAQINFRPSASLEEAYEKLCYDMFYIKNRSLVLDALIMLKTLRCFWARQPKADEPKNY